MRANISIYTTVNAFVTGGAVDGARANVGRHNVTDRIDIAGVVGVIGVSNVGVGAIFFMDSDSVRHAQRVFIIGNFATIASGVVD